MTSSKAFGGRSEHFLATRVFDAFMSEVEGSSMKALTCLFYAGATVYFAQPQGIAYNGPALLAAAIFLIAAAFFAVREVVRSAATPRGLVP